MVGEVLESENSDIEDIQMLNEQLSSEASGFGNPF
jgi:hypothetical protein